METGVSLHCSHELVNGPYPKPDVSIPHPPTFFFKTRFSNPLSKK